MSLFFKGFNLFGQVFLNEHVLSEFAKIDFKNRLRKFEVMHTFSVAQLVDKKVIYYGPTDGNLKEICLNDNSKYKFIDFSTFDDKILLLTDLGHIFKVEITDLNCLIELPKISLDENDKIVNICCGSKISVASSKEGKLFNFGNKLEFNSKEIIDIKCGREHCLILLNNGELYSFGRGSKMEYAVVSFVGNDDSGMDDASQHKKCFPINCKKSRGQLGHGRLDDLTNPTIVSALAGIKITSIAAGSWHSCAIDESGALYTWGWNGNGQLGLGNKKTSEGTSGNNFSVMASPCLIEFDGEKDVLNVGCGSRHTIVLLENNDIFGCGWNKYKQLRNENEEHYNKFTYLHNFSQYTYFNLFCGAFSTAIFCNKK